MEKREDPLHFKEKLSKIFKKEGEIKKALKKGETPACFLEIQREEIDFLFFKAKNLLDKELFEKAVDAFFFLIVIDPNKVDSWLGMGISLQKLSHFEEAIDAYEMGAIIDPENPYPYLLLSKCFFALHDHKNAMESITMGKALAEENLGKYGGILEEIGEIYSKISSLL